MGSGRLRRRPSLSRAPPEALQPVDPRVQLNLGRRQWRVKARRRSGAAFPPRIQLNPKDSDPILDTRAWLDPGPAAGEAVAALNIAVVPQPRPPWAPATLLLRVYAEHGLWGR